MNFAGPTILSAYLPKHFSQLCEMINRPGLLHDKRYSTNAARAENRESLIKELNDAVKELDLTAEELVTKFGEHGIVAGHVKSMDDIRPGRGEVSADLFVSVGMPNGTSSLSLPGLPFTLKGVTRSAGGIPKLGGDNKEVLKNLAK